MKGLVSKQAHALDLVFIHIHKTGGKSVSRILEDVYGSSHYRINQNVLRENKLVEIPGDDSVVPYSTRVLSGHLTFRSVKPILGNQTKVITWLRHPVDRVISNYLWRKHLNQEGRSSNYPLTSPDLTIEAFIHLERNQNRMSRFLRDLNLEDLFYIGFLESFDEDIQTLSTLLNWPEIQLHHINKRIRQDGTDPKFSSEVITAIEALNAEDIELYKKARSISDERKIQLSGQ